MLYDLAVMEEKLSEYYPRITYKLHICKGFDIPLYIAMLVMFRTQDLSTVAARHTKQSKSCHFDTLSKGMVVSTQITDILNVHNTFATYHSPVYNTYYM